MAWLRATAAVRAIVMVVEVTAGVAAAAVVVAKEMANAKQTIEAEAKTQQSTIKNWHQRRRQKWCGGRQWRTATRQ